MAKKKIISVTPELLKVPPPETPPSIAVLFNADAKEAIRAAKALGPKGFVMVFESRPVDKVPDFSTLANDRILQPMYIGNIAHKSRVSFVMKWVKAMMDAGTIDFTKRQG